MNKKTYKISRLTTDLTITLLMFDIINNERKDYLAFSTALGAYWNERIRNSPEDFPSIWKEREKKTITR